ncbi:MAG: hypothetical protein D3906_03470 [Candidatus Electrothrix sp. AUS1_2]|nr:hypothetical protein [Candidatus Electrothrix sp. AUS1_2]
MSNGNKILLFRRPVNIFPVLFPVFFIRRICYSFFLYLMQVTMEITLFNYKIRLETPCAG